MPDRAKLGRLYASGEVVCSQGDIGNCLYVVQQGEVEILAEADGTTLVLGVARKDELLGEMAIFLRGTRSATVRARGPARVLTIDKRTLLRRLSEDPTVAFRLLETMARRLRELDRKVLELTRAHRTDA
jgi:CRP-like cAMP-binding protein